MMNHKIKQILIIIALALFNTGCEKDPASSSDPIPDGLSITYPEDYVDGILTVVVEGEEDGHEDHDDDAHSLVGGFQLELEDHDDDDHDDHDHGDEEHCEDFTSESDCGMHSECEWHEDDSACEDADGDHDDHDHGDDDGHSIFSGFQLWEENMTTATYSQIGLAVSGEITLAVGETKEYMVMFLDDDDDHDHGDEEHCEDFTTEADCGAHAECEWHADDMACEDADGDNHDHGDDDHEEGAGHISITGVSAGTTSFQVKVMHNGHADYTSLPIDITVTAGSSN